MLAGYDEQNCQIIVQVADTGTGIAADEIPFLCQKFGKLFRTAEMNSEGVGFGLMISKALIEANDGVLKIASEGVNKGSVFQFTMKMQYPAEKATASGSAADDPQKSGQRGKLEEGGAASIGGE